MFYAGIIVPIPNKQKLLGFCDRMEKKEPKKKPTPNIDERNGFPAWKDKNYFQ